MNWVWPCSPPFPPFPRSILLFASPNVVSSFVFHPSSPICATKIFIDKWLSNGAGHPTSGNTLKTDSPSLSSYQLLIASQLELGLHPPFPLHAGIWAFIGHVLAVIATVSLAYVHLHCCVQWTVSFYLFTSSGSYPLLPPFLQNAWFWGRVGVV